MEQERPGVGGVSTGSGNGNATVEREGDGFSAPDYIVLPEGVGHDHYWEREAFPRTIFTYHVIASGT